MNCEKLETVVSALAREEIEDANERATALTHIDRCGRCARILEEQRRLSANFRALAQQMNAIEAPVRLERRILASLQQRSVVRTFPAKRRLLPNWAGALAAAILLLIGGFAVWRFQHQVLQPPAQADDGGAPRYEPPGKDQLLQEKSPDSGQDRHRVAKSVNHLTKSHRLNRGNQLRQDLTVDASAQTAEVATDFLSLGYGSASDLQDGGQLVRVELPRLALARFGLPVNMDRADERVKADVLVGADGLARAIRFVR